MKAFFSTLLAVCALGTGCATGTHIATNGPIKIYATTPTETFEVVGLVDESGQEHFGGYAKAVERAQRDVEKLGGNGLLITTTGHDFGRIYVTGQAIRVHPGTTAKAD